MGKFLGSTPISPGEANDILTFIHKNPDAPVKKIAFTFGRSESAIRDLIAKYKPTTALARATLLAKASEMVDRVVDKADVDQIVDILSRPNVGVLEPIAAKGGSGGNPIGVFVSVSPGALAAVDASTYDSGKHDGRPALPPGEAETLDGEVVKGKRLFNGAKVVGEVNS